MRVALCVKSIDGTGGIQRNYKLWYEMFKKRGVETYLFILEEPKYEQLDDHIILLEGKNIKQKGLSLQKHLKSLGRFDLFLLNAEYLKGYINQPYYITVHNTWEISGNLLKKLKRSRALKQKYYNEHVIGISKSVVDNITDNLKIQVKSKHVVYAPHNIERVRKLADEKEINGDFIVSVGSLIKRKNHELLLKSFAILDSDLDLFIVGEGPEKENLQKLAKKLGIEKRVKFTGFEQNPYPYIKNAKVLVSSSNSEGLPRVIVESLILNTPVVSTYSSEGVYEVMEKELKEFVVPKNDEKTLSEKIKKALESYPEIKEKYYKKFSEEESFKRFVSLSSGCGTSSTDLGIL